MAKAISGRLIDWIERRQPLERFQLRFIRGAFAPGVHLAVLSGPRGIGKTSLSGWLLAAALDPDGPLHVPASESVMLAASLDQARAGFGVMRDRCGEDGFRYMDSAQRIRATHVASRARVRVASSDAKRALGILNAPLLVGDEPAAWEDRGGAAMFDALTTSGGKTEQRLILIGTRAPGPAGGWWRQLVASGGGPGEYVQTHAGDDEDDTWWHWRNVRRANPLIGANPHLGPKLRTELAKARRDDDAKRRFLSYRLNRPTEAASAVLLTVKQWADVEARPVPVPVGRPIVGVDCGSSRAWSTAAILWRSGRLGAICVTPGVPDLAAQERRDAKPRGLYRRLADKGLLHVDDGRRVVRVETLIDRVMAFRPEVIVADRFRFPEVIDAVRGRCPVVSRTTRWSEQTADIMALRRLASDGDLSVEPSCRPLYVLALAESTVQQDDGDNLRLVKRDTNNRHRDDLAAALVLAAGALDRAPPVVKRSRLVIA